MLVFILVNNEEPPSELVHKAGRMIYTAETLKASLYSAEQYKLAKAFYDSAMLAWYNENQRWLPLRDFKKAKEYALLSYSHAEKAVKLSGEKIVATEELLEFRISLLESRLKDLIENYKKIPTGNESSGQLGSIEILLSEGKYAYQHGNYPSTTYKLDLVDSLILKLTDHYAEILLTYFEMFPQWTKWVDFVVHESKRNRSACIVVDKFARECILYKNGKIINRFEAEFGANWIGDKNQQGDKSTPEGLYKIERKKSSGDTRYYKALLLDYPNEDDKKRFILNKKNNVISQDARIGDLIEIHGSGGRGIDWTDGCVALMDSDINILFEACKVGTRVAIVGSTRSYERLFFNKVNNEEHENVAGEQDNHSKND